MANLNLKNLDPEDGISISDLLENWEEIEKDKPEIIMITDKGNINFQKTNFGSRTIITLPHAMGRINASYSNFEEIIANKAEYITLFSNKGVKAVEAKTASWIVLNETPLLEKFCGPRVYNLWMSYSALKEIDCKKPLTNFYSRNSGFAKSKKEMVQVKDNLFYHLEAGHDTDFMIAYNAKEKNYTLCEFSGQIEQVTKELLNNIAVDEDIFRKEIKRVVDLNNQYKKNKSGLYVKQ